MGNTFIFQVSFGIWQTRIRCWLGFFRWCFEKIFIWTWIRNNTCAFLSWSRARRRRCCLFGRLRNITWRLLLVFFRYSFSWSISFWNFKYFINSIYMQYIYNWGELNISQNSVIFVTEYFYWCEKNMILKSFAETLRNSFDFRWKFKILMYSSMRMTFRVGLLVQMNIYYMRKLHTFRLTIVVGFLPHF